MAEAFNDLTLPAATYTFTASLASRLASDTWLSPRGARVLRAALAAFGGRAGGLSRKSSGKVQGGLLRRPGASC